MLTFPQASLRSRAAGFPRLGSDLGIALQAFPTAVKLKCWHTYTPPSPVCFAGWSLWWLIPVSQLTDPVTAKCPEPLCPMSAYLDGEDVLRLLERHYPFFLAHTDSCAKPLPSFRFRFALIRKVFAGCCQRPAA